MNIKFLLILAILVAAGYYAVEVKGINPFAKKIADDVPFRKFDGEVTTMKDLQGENGTLILSMSTWCPHCVEQLVNVYPLNEGFQQYKINVVLIVHGPDRDATILKTRQDIIMEQTEMTISVQVTVMITPRLMRRTICMEVTAMIH